MRILDVIRGSQRRYLISVAILIAGSVMVGSAWAHHFGPGYAGFVAYADNANHTFYYITTWSPAKTVVERARINNLNPTDMTSQVQSSYNHDTDVLVRSASLPSGTAGLTSCGRWTSTSNVCNQFNLTISTVGTPISSVGCHELGHTVGLAHDDDSGYNGCMRSNISGTHSIWTTHDVNHVNARY